MVVLNIGTEHPGVVESVSGRNTVHPKIIIFGSP